MVMGVDSRDNNFHRQRDPCFVQVYCRAGESRDVETPCRRLVLAHLADLSNSTLPHHQTGSDPAEIGQPVNPVDD